MPVNIEIKARCPRFERTEELARQISDSGPITILQQDVFFQTQTGRLKLRIFPVGNGELIYYERSDTSGPKSSEYSIAPTPDAAALKATLARALGIRGVVKKTRLLYLAGQTRIHLDTVEGLGTFLELEVVMKPGQELAEGRQIADALLKHLETAPDELLESAYIDMLENVHTKTGTRSTAS